MRHQPKHLPTFFHIHTPQWCWVCCLLWLFPFNTWATPSSLLSPSQSNRPIFTIKGKRPLRKRVRVRFQLSHPQLPVQVPMLKYGLQASQKSTKTVYLKVGLQGHTTTKHQRAPVNLAVVLDRSGSMKGEKLRETKRALKMLISRMGPRDTFSLITYNSTVQVLVPATRVRDPKVITRKIERITAKGATALFGGVSRGLGELKTFLHQHRVNRMILISDGRANIGPRRPSQLGRLGAASAVQGISITTIGLGLGYNEDLMTQLALKSDGNYGFADNSKKLTTLLASELQDIFSVVAQRVTLHIRCAKGVKPIRVLDRTARIEGQHVRLTFNQLNSQREKYVLLELKLPSSQRTPQTKQIAQINVRYNDMLTRRMDTLTHYSSIAYKTPDTANRSKVNKDIMVKVIAATANEINKNAVSVRDSGYINKARGMLRANANFLNKMARKYKSKTLQQLGQFNYTNADSLKSPKWRYSRKLMRKKQYQIQNQTSY